MTFLVSLLLTLNLFSKLIQCFLILSLDVFTLREDIVNQCHNTKHLCLLFTREVLLKV